MWAGSIPSDSYSSGLIKPKESSCRKISEDRGSTRAISVSSLLEACFFGNWIFLLERSRTPLSLPLRMFWRKTYACKGDNLLLAPVQRLDFSPVDRSVIAEGQFTHKFNVLGFLVPCNTLAYKMDELRGFRTLSLLQQTDGLDPLFPFGVRNPEDNGLFHGRML